MRRVLRRVARAADVTENFAATQALALVEAGSVAIEMSVVIAEALVGIELVDGEASGLTGEKFLHDPVIDGDDGCAARRHDVDRFVAVIASSLAEHVAHRTTIDTDDGDDDAARCVGIPHRRRHSLDRLLGRRNRRRDGGERRKDFRSNGDLRRRDRRRRAGPLVRDEGNGGRPTARDGV